MLKVTREFKNLPVGLEIPEGDHVVLTGSNNSGKSALIQYMNATNVISNASDYISIRRFEPSDTIGLPPNADSQIADMRNSRKRQDVGIAELADPNATRQLIGLSDHDREIVIQWHNRFFGELKLGLGDTADFKLMVGWNFK